MRNGQLWPSLGIVAASAGWGLFWLPLRALDAGGVQGAWATFALFAVGAVALLPFALTRLGRLRRLGGRFLLTGLCSGGAWILYTNSLLLTEVVRALLMFYLTPLWSVLLLRALHGERITAPRLVTIAMGLGGLGVILGFEGGVPLPRNAGDWMGLASGFIWAYAGVRLRREQTTGTLEGVIAFFACGGALAGLLVVLPFAALGSPPSLAAMADQGGIIVLLAVGFVVPSMLLIVGGARRLDPARVGILLMTEAVVGTISAAILTDEPFGAREAVGAALILAAGVLDVLAVGAHQPPVASQRST